VTTISDQELLDAFPDTRIDHDNKEFYRGWLERRLLLNRCLECGRWHHPPQPICPDCWSRHVEPSEISGTGVIHLLMLLHQGPPAPDVDYSRPHPVATVELAEQEGLRYSSTVVNCPQEEIRIGMPVRLTWIERWGAPYPVFEPDPARTPGASAS
jgi:uncharacterized OB-fold protein